MSLFKKKPQGEIPEIPPAPTLPPFNLAPEQKREPTGLPTMPGDARDTINRDVIKSAVEDSSEKIDGDGVAENSPSLIVNEPVNEQSIVTTQQVKMPIPLLPVIPRQGDKHLPPPPRYDKPSFSESLPTPPQKENSPSPSFEPKNLENNKFEETQKISIPEVKVVRKDANESIFVRIDKFHSAKHDIEDVEKDLRQINNVIEKITDIKIREDEEILEINKTLEEIKEKLSKIDAEIFNRI
jgi:hypothetical protein